MTMLSSVAERLYWMSRYLERAEDTARLVSAYNHLIMDIPRGAEPGWDILIRILAGGRGNRVCLTLNSESFVCDMRLFSLS